MNVDDMVSEGNGDETERAIRMYLAIIKCTFDGNVVDVGICDGGHLRFLDGRNAALGMEDEDGDVGFVPETIDGSAGGWRRVKLA
jgi:hypothetical protein